MVTGTGRAAVHSLFICAWEAERVGLRRNLCGPTAIAFAALALGCGGSDFPRAAEPAASPPLRSRAAGTVAELGARPEGMVFDRAAGLLAVVVREPDRLEFVDPATLAVVRGVPLPAPARHLALAPSGAAVLVPAEAANEVLEVAPRRGVLASVPVGEHPHDAASAAGSVFVSDERADAVSVLRGGREVATLAAPAQPGGITAVGGRYIALVAVAERVLEVYDARTREALGRAPAGTGPTHVVGLGDAAYVADTEAGLVREFRIGRRPRQVATAAAPGAPYGIDVDPRRRRLWVTLTARNRLAGYALGGRRPRRFAAYPTVRQPNSVAVDPRSGDVFVAGRGGRLERIAPGGGGAP